MENKKFTLRETSAWFIQHALEMYKIGLRDNICGVLNYTPKLNYKTLLSTDTPTHFTDNCIIGKYGWVHHLDYSEKQRLINSETYQKISLDGLDVSDQYPWNIRFDPTIGAAEDAPFAEPQIQVSDEYEGSAVQIWRLNLFVDDNPDFDTMCKNGTYGDYLENGFKREVVVIQKESDQSIRIIPCHFGWLFSPEWDSYCKKAWKYLIDSEPIVIGNHKLRGSWGPFEESKKLSTLFR